MAEFPILRSQRQIYGQIVDFFLARAQNVAEVNASGLIGQMFTAISHGQFKADANAITMADALSSERAVGEALQRIAKDADVPVLPAKASSNYVAITDTTFTKIETTVYTGQSAPVAGSLIIFATDLSKASTTGGRIYIGRGTVNEEGPLTYTSITTESGGSYYKITLASSTPTTKFHNIGEKIVIAQGGNRLIPVSALVKTPEGGSTTSVSFITTANTTIYDGEVTAPSVPVKCTQTGIIGNVPRGSISETVGLSFAATVYNANAFTNGKEADTDDELRIRIKAYEQAKAKGVESAIVLAAQGTTSPDENKTVQSASVVRYTDLSSALVFDDGSGYEAITQGVGIETVIDNALGGEKELQLRNRAIANSRLKSTISEPFDVYGSETLEVAVQSIKTTFTIQAANMKTLGKASALELATAINADYALNFSAATESGYLIITPKDRNSNDIQALGGTALNLIGFGTAIAYSLRLYKNDLPLYQDGIDAYVDSLEQSSWSVSAFNGAKLTFAVDGTPTQTITIYDADFQLIDPASTASKATPLSMWATVLTKKMAGVKVEVNGQRLRFYSRAGSVSDASIVLTNTSPTPAIDFKSTCFDPLAVTVYAYGAASDYTFNPQTGQLALVVPLVAGDKVTLGSPLTRARVMTSDLASGPTTNGKAFIAVDGSVTFKSNGLASNTLVTFTRGSGSSKLHITATDPSLVPVGFDTVLAGDWVAVWANVGDVAPDASATGFWRVESATVGELIVNTDSTSAIATSPSVVNLDRIVLVNSLSPIQMLSFVPDTLSNFVALASTMAGVDVEVVGNKVRIMTQSYVGGEIAVVAVDAGARAIGLSSGTVSKNIISHLGSVVVSDTEAGVPNFAIGAVVSSPTDTTLEDPNYLNLGGTNANFIEVLNKYTGTNTLIDSAKGLRELATSFDPLTNYISTLTPSYMKAGQTRVQGGDRYILRSPFQFDSNDTLSVIVDGEATTQLFTLPVSRKLKALAGATPTSFDASDAESSLPLNHVTSFNSFDFTNFKVWRQPSTNLVHGAATIKINAIGFGPSADKVRAGIVYPRLSTQLDVGHIINVGEVIDLSIVLPFKTMRIPNWDIDTAFTVSKTTTGGKDLVTFTYEVGTTPDFSATGAAVVMGDVVAIDDVANFLSSNRGFSAKVVAVTPTSFTVCLPKDVAVSDNTTIVSAFSNVSGTTSVTFSAPHQIVAGQRIGLFSTAEVTTGVKPFDTTYLPVITGPNTITFTTPVAAPKGLIVSATHINNVITVTSMNHGLTTDNIVTISGVGSSSYDSTFSVFAVLNANQFQVVRQGSAPSVASGRFDFQSLSATVNPVDIATISTISRAATTGLATVVCVAPPTFIAGALVRLENVVIDTYSSIAGYNIGDVVEFSGFNYKAIQAGVNHQPDISPTWWSITDMDLTGTFVVESKIGSTFTFYYADTTGVCTGTGGVAAPVIATGYLARALGTNSLVFGEVGATAQEISTYVNTSAAEIAVATVVAGASTVVDTSTQDEDEITNYLSGNVTSVKTISGSQFVVFDFSTSVAKGSSVTVAGSAYAGSYVVLDVVQALPVYKVKVLSSITAAATADVVITTTFIGSTPLQGLTDGENGVLSQNLGGSPQFTMKQAWSAAPTVDEEIRLVACTSDQLTRFWNLNIISGIKNLASVKNSNWGRALEFTTNQFGANGSIQVLGGKANSGVAVMTSASTPILSKAGYFEVAAEAASGIVAGQYVAIENGISQIKVIGLAPSTQVTVASGTVVGATNKVTITGPGSFQAKRTLAVVAGKIFAIEKHGAFMALLALDSTPFTNVQESDWLELGSVFGTVNAGIYQVVRVNGGNSVWFESSSYSEIVVAAGASTDVKAYAYDSVMAGDSLYITDPILYSQNMAKSFTVVEVTSSTIIEVAGNMTNKAATLLGNAYEAVTIMGSTPTRAIKRVHAVSPRDASSAIIIVDSAPLMDKFAPALLTEVTVLGKLGFTTYTVPGVDAYKYYLGLVKELNRVIYGDPTNPLSYPGVAAAGAFIDIRPAQLKRISIGLGLRIRDNTNFDTIRDQVRAAVSGYVNSLRVGQQVAISEMIGAATNVTGVDSVVVTFPTYDAATDLIAVGFSEKAYIINSETDIVVTVL